ncbi:class II histone deacetylase [Pelagibius sp. Alg239-R121]|uniref:class II histone deacetylase n=1 Tax=Pelagibius sp. Alg239-R121 TaxID=2993448 RepID=UPI0024A745A9|nr:class II histone deacetylase [Pelagibius sp. Alg239-R121]
MGLGAHKTGFVWNERFMWHITGIAAGVVPAGGFVEPGLFHIENETAKRRIRNLLDVSGLLGQLEQIEAESAQLQDLRRVHTDAYLERFQAQSAAGGGEVGEKAVVGPNSWEIARLAVGGCLRAADAILDRRVANAYALVRPAGHHAEPDQGRGFCLLSNGCITVEYLRAVHGVERIAIVDWDAHHGNGAQKLYYADERVLTISVHEVSNFPVDSGELAETGQGEGAGANINVPLPPGTGHHAYLAVAETVIAPALSRFRPDFILVSSGFDGSLYDPLARQMAMSETYRALSATVRASAEALCNGRLLMLHEGGYSEFYTPFCGLAVLEALSGIRTEVEDPFLAHLSKPVHSIRDEQAAVIEAAAALAAQVPTTTLRRKNTHDTSNQRS